MRNNDIIVKKKDLLDYKNSEVEGLTLKIVSKLILDL